MPLSSRWRRRYPNYYDSTELFAEAFWRFYTDNETLAANYPKLYALMSRVCPTPDN